ncbi:AraC family transcriptional regulator [Streptomyces caniscabiei]|uniref:AraC family transcriptional regulator n=1 Tax=Streptomyces caniscabiei TaxID=2746961 RepID=UPI0029BE149B|nr:AraC family transcriptional regulator [Streptomyces caniscabiei]MDX2776056.1 AraC family transcriptional regulator [Streptomyces caniscabiei]
MYEQRILASSLVHLVWRAVAKYDGTYSDPANEYWSIGFVRHVDGATSADVYGPSLVPRTVDSHQGEAYWGIEFHAHVAIRHVDKGDILNSDTPLFVEDAHVFLAGHRYSVPAYDELEAFAVRLEKDGVLVNNQRILRAIQGDERGFSERSRQRHFRTTTGLNKKQIEQLRRARRAFYLLQQGYSATEAAQNAGYADQAHMTRSFKVLRGETPARIIAAYLKRR